MLIDPPRTPFGLDLGQPLVSEPLQAAVLLLTLAVYVGLTLYFRWNEAALPIRNHLHAELERACAALRVARGMVRSHAGTGPVHPDDAGALVAAERLLRQADAAIPRRRRGNALWEFLCWSRGEEVKMLHCIRNAERVLVRFDPREAVQARLAEPEDALMDPVTGPERGPWAPRSSAATATLPETEEAARAMLEEKLRIVHEHEVRAVDDNLTEIMRATWIMFLCVGMILACAAVLGHAYLFLGGAIGGLIGRMARVTQVEETSAWVFQDTRAAKLIASPALGAVAGWTGVLLVSATGIDLLGAGDPWLPGTTHGHVEAFALALLLGCSEPLLNRVLSNATRRERSEHLTGAPTSSPRAPGEDAGAQPAAT